MRVWFHGNNTGVTDVVGSSWLLFGSQNSIPRKFQSGSHLLTDVYLMGVRRETRGVVEGNQCHVDVYDVPMVGRSDARGRERDDPLGNRLHHTLSLRKKIIFSSMKKGRDGGHPVWESSSPSSSLFLIHSSHCRRMR